MSGTDRETAYFVLNQRLCIGAYMYYVIILFGKGGGGVKVHIYGDNDYNNNIIINGLFTK